MPHIILAQNFVKELRLQPQDVPEQYREVVGREIFGPTDWAKFRSYYEAFFEYVLVTRGFRNAEFEVANEPDIGGGIYPFPPKPAMGSRALYEATFTLYRNVAEAAVSFEQKHPGVPVRLGGPSLAWGFTFKFGDFNWTEHFLRDCHDEQVKLNFLTLHYYGNQSSLDGEYPALYPSFVEMLRVTRAAVDAYEPGLPIYFTEWGPSYHTENSESAAVNANSVGAAWGAAFLNTLLSCRIDKALYLTSTDLRQQENGKWVDAWGWDALFLDPAVYGGQTYPKPMFHLFDMISRLAGHRVESTRGSRTVNDFVSADPEQRKITMLVWNYDAVLPEGGVYEERALPQETEVHVRDAGNFFHTPQVKVEAWQINANTDNIYQMLTTGVAPDENNTAMAKLPTTVAKIDHGGLTWRTVLPPSSVSLVVLTESE